MRSRATRQFWRLFRELPPGVQRDARRVYALFSGNPSHPGLQFKKVEGTDHIYPVRVGIGYRALGVMRGDHIVWYWGSHSQYDRLV